MSTRDQRVGTSHPDIVKEDVSLEYITMSHRYGPRGATKEHTKGRPTLCSGNVLVHDSRRPSISLSEPEEQKLY